MIEKQYINNLKKFNKKIENLYKANEYDDKKLMSIIKKEYEEAKNELQDVPENVWKDFYFNFWKSAYRIINFSKTSLSIEYFYSICQIYGIFADFFINFEEIKERLINYDQAKKLNLEYVEWMKYFEKEIMQKLAELIFNLNYEYAYSLDAVIRGLRVLEENLLVWLLIMESTRKLWDPQYIFKIYDYKRNESRLRTFEGGNFSNCYQTVTYNGRELGLKEYLAEIKSINEKHEYQYDVYIKELKLEAEKLIKKKYNMSKKNLNAIKKILKIENKQKRRHQLLDYVNTELDISNKKRYEKNGKRVIEDISDNEKCEILEKQIIVLERNFKFPKDVYEHINNVMVLKGNTFYRNSNNIKSFFKYMEEHTTTKSITRAASDIEFNMSNHISFEGIMFNEMKLLCNKITPIREFLLNFRSNYADYTLIIVEIFYDKKYSDKIKKELNEK